MAVVLAACRLVRPTFAPPTSTVADGFTSALRVTVTTLSANDPLKLRLLLLPTPDFAEAVIWSWRRVQSAESLAGCSVGLVVVCAAV